jgi:BirA family transcriptional regulator, biotin operon repressor / biotin---[acetyl-CoA-carboxylase] ligase
VDRAPLDPSALATWPGAGRWRVEVLEESPSTNAALAARARAGEPAGLVLVAEHQTAGRGRLDRVWVTPPRAALTFSVLVSPVEVPLARWPWLPLLTGLAVVDGVRAAAAVETSLKWPNDVLAGPDKVAGILVERLERPAGAMAGAVAGAVAVVGVGLNVSATREELPVDTATSLSVAGATSLDRTRLLTAVLDAFAVRYDAWRAAAGNGLRAPYLQASSTVGRQVRVELPGGGRLRGRAEDVDEEGRLRVDDGTRVHALGAGDVVHVRPEVPPG